MVNNDAENLVQIVDKERFFNGTKLKKSQMLWKCSVENCSTEPKIRLRSTYSKILYCNSCSNKLKCQDPDFLKKRGQRISESIKNLGNKWSETSKKNQSNLETKNKISNSVKNYISKNKEISTQVRSKTAIKNNLNTGFGTSEFSKKIWDSQTDEDKSKRSNKISLKNKLNGEKVHRQLAADRFPEFKIIDYTGVINKYKCPEDHEFEMLGNNFIKRGNCPECSPKSSLEIEMYNWLSNYIPDLEKSKRVLYLTDEKNGNKALEIDIYSPNKKFGIEIHGLYYHRHIESDSKRDINYHKFKTELAEKHGITLLQFFEDEILYKNEIVKSVILSKLGLNQNVVYAKKTTLKQLTKKEEVDFLNNNHLQGSCKSYISFGLFYNEDLICMVSFRKMKGTNKIEIARFCNKLNTSVVGGFSKLMKFAKKELKSQGFQEIITYSDRRYSNGSLYGSNGFLFRHFTVPDMFWVKGYERFARQISWGMKDQEMYDRKYFKIYGAGHAMWSLDLK